MEHEIEIIFDDNLGEFVELFAIVGVIGPDVSGDFTCFKYFDYESCQGGKGAIGIFIVDDDC